MPNTKMTKNATVQQKWEKCIILLIVEVQLSSSRATLQALHLNIIERKLNEPT